MVVSEALITEEEEEEEVEVDMEDRDEEEDMEELPRMDSEEECRGVTHSSMLIRLLSLSISD